MNAITNDDIEALAQELLASPKRVILTFAFNGTGKTRLCMAYKNITKARNGGKHAGVYYSAYSEDLFVWDNDSENAGTPVKLNITPSSLNQYHASLVEEKLREKLFAYKPAFDFQFVYIDDDPSLGIQSIFFYPQSDGGDQAEPIKISRGEQQVFIWCLFLTMFDVQGWAGEQSSHFFIDDPVSSLDDHNIFVTASTIMDLIDAHYEQRKIIVTTHHVGLFAMLSDWLTKGEKADAYKRVTQTYVLKNDSEKLRLSSCREGVFLYHLELLSELRDAIADKQLYAYHFALLRQALENISSFLGVGRFAYVLEQIGIDHVDEVARIVNILSHKNVFRYEAKELVPDNKELFVNVFDKLQEKYHFVL